MSQSSCYLLDLERTIKLGQAFYWMPNNYGYTTKIAEAGLFSEAAAKKIADNDMDDRTVVIPEHVVNRIME